MDLERARAAEKGYESPILPDIQATHKSFNTGVQLVLEHMANGGKANILVATHNQQSIEHTVRFMEVGFVDVSQTLCVAMS